MFEKFQLTHQMKVILMCTLVTLSIVFAYISITLPCEYIAGGILVSIGKHVDIGESLMGESALGVCLSYIGFASLGILRLYLAGNKRNSILLALLLGGLFLLRIILSVTIPSISGEQAYSFGIITLFLPYIVTLPMMKKDEEEEKEPDFNLFAGIESSENPEDYYDFLDPKWLNENHCPEEPKKPDNDAPSPAN